MYMYVYDRIFIYHSIIHVKYTFWICLSLPGQIVIYYDFGDHCENNLIYQSNKVDFVMYILSNYRTRFYVVVKFVSKPN